MLRCPVCGRMETILLPLCLLECCGARMRATGGEEYGYIGASPPSQIRLRVISSREKRRPDYDEAYEALLRSLHFMTKVLEYRKLTASTQASHPWRRYLLCVPMDLCLSVLGVSVAVSLSVSSSVSVSVSRSVSSSVPVSVSLSVSLSVSVSVSVSFSISMCLDMFPNGVAWVDWWIAVET